MRRRLWLALLLIGTLGCGGSPPGGPAALRREVGAGGPTSLPAARVSYGSPLALEAAPPISLTTSDGTGLVMTALDARAVVDGPLAFTELHLTFENPQDRVLEGRFAITLPDGAAISRFAMKIDGRWMEAEMVERMAARRAYEDFLHRAQDPALLEKEAGNEFRARVFPIPARGRKELIVSYSQELADPEQPYRLPLVGLPRIGAVKARVQVARVDGAAIAWDEVTLAERDWQPDHDLAVPASAASEALGAGGVVAMRIVPELSARAQPVTAATVLVDTSASRAAGYREYAREVAAAIAALGDAEVTVAAFDQGIEPLYQGRARGAAAAIEEALLGRMPLGASDLEAALRWATRADQRVIVIGDGVPTAGALEPAALARLRGGERIDVVLAGGIRDRAVARAVAGDDGAVLALDDGAAEVARRLGQATRSGLAVVVEGAREVWPAQLDGVQPGDAAMVYAWFGGKTPRTVTLTVGDDRRRLPVQAAAEPLVRRAGAQAEIARLEAGLDGADPAARTAAIDRVVAISTRERVLSDHTALLVLETEEDYRRFGIDRAALSGILVVGARGVEVQRRDDVAVIATDGAPAGAEAAPRDPSRVEESDGDDADDKGKEKKKDEAREVEARPDPAKVAAPEAPAPPPSLLEPLEAPSPAPSLAPPPVTDTEIADEDQAPGGQGYGESGEVRGVAAGAAVSRPGAAVERRRSARRASHSRSQQIAQPEPAPERTGPPAYTGRMATVMALIERGQQERALDEALAWRAEDAGDVMALIGLGEALEATDRPALAARAYGSLIDLFPARADLRRFAGERLDRLAVGRDLAIDSYRRAVAQRPDHLTGHRLLALALVRAGRTAEAFAALEHGLAQRYPGGRFAGGERILREDLGLVAAAWLRAEPKRRAAILRRLRAADAVLEDAPSTRFVLSWETDANDVDFHVRDGRGGHAFYSEPRLASGGELYADVTTGYGPECFTIRGDLDAAPYALSIHYYSRGPMGYGMGTLQVVRHDGDGRLTVEDRPFVVMNDDAYVDLGQVR